MNRIKLAAILTGATLISTATTPVLARNGNNNSNGNGLGNSNADLQRISSNICNHLTDADWHASQYTTNHDQLKQKNVDLIARLQQTQTELLAQNVDTTNLQLQIQELQQHLNNWEQNQQGVVSNIQQAQTYKTQICANGQIGGEDIMTIITALQTHNLQDLVPTQINDVISQNSGDQDLNSETETDNSDDDDEDNDSHKKDKDSNQSNEDDRDQSEDEDRDQGQQSDANSEPKTHTRPSESARTTPTPFPTDANRQSQRVTLYNQANTSDTSDTRFTARAMRQLRQQNRTLRAFLSRILAQVNRTG